MRLIKTFIACLLLSSFASCDDDSVSMSRVNTEDFVYVSSERLLITGRVLIISTQGLSDHGFQVSKSEDFSDFITLSLGPKQTPGKFIGEFDDLEPGVNYFCRSYAEDETGLVTGNIKEVTTLNPFIESFTPSMAIAGEVITIKGRNFTQSVEVYFGDQRAEILENNFESELLVKVPNPSSQVTTNIRVVNKGTDLIFDNQFEYIIGEWEEVAKFLPGIEFAEGIYFQEGNTAYFGLGFFGEVNDHNDKIWQANITDWNWTEVPFSGPALRGSFFSQGVFGGGSLSFNFGTSTNETQSWSLENGNISTFSTLPFALYKAIAFQTDEKIWVIGGEDEDLDDSFSIFIYSKLTSTWEESELTTPVAFNTSNPHFQYDGFFYIITEDKSLWRFNIESKEWQNIGTYPGGAIIDGFAEVLGDKVFIGLGDRRRDMYEYDIITNQWKRKIDFTGNQVYINVAQFSDENHIYFIRRYSGPSQQNPDNSMQIWRFSPYEF